MEVGLTMGGVGFLLPPPDMISSVISLPPWFGSRILIYGVEHRENSCYSLSRERECGQDGTPLGSAGDALGCAGALQFDTWKCELGHASTSGPGLIRTLTSHIGYV